MAKRSWSGIQKLARPVNAAVTRGPWVDTFYRRKLDLWVVWAFLPPDESGTYNEIIILGGFKDRARACFAADTALAACRPGSGVMPMIGELLAEGDFLDVLHGISHIADCAPWHCEHRASRSLLSKLGPTDVELLTQQIEKHAEKVQDWRFMWLGPPGHMPSPTLVRVRNQQPAAAIVIHQDLFSDGTVNFWLDETKHQLPCAPTEIAENVLSSIVLDNLAKVMDYCDSVLKDKYGADSNAPALISLLRDANVQESSRQIAQAFGTAHIIGEA